MFKWNGHKYLQWNKNQNKGLWMIRVSLSKRQKKEIVESKMLGALEWIFGSKVLFRWNFRFICGLNGEGLCRVGWGGVEVVLGVSGVLSIWFLMSRCVFLLQRWWRKTAAVSLAGIDAAPSHNASISGDLITPGHPNPWRG